MPVCSSAQTHCIISCRGAAGFLAAFSSFFFAWYTLFTRAVYFGFFTTAAVGSFRFCFPLEADPEESQCRSFLPSTKSSLVFVAVLTASNHSLSSAIGSIMDILLTASSGIWSSIIFLKATPVTLALTFQFSISSRNWSMSPLYLTFIISRRAFTSSWVGPKRRTTCSAQIGQNSYPSSLVKQVLLSSGFASS